jgi:hypothetical protein
MNVLLQKLSGGDLCSDGRANEGCSSCILLVREPKWCRGFAVPILGASEIITSAERHGGLCPWVRSAAVVRL